MNDDIVVALRAMNRDFRETPRIYVSPDQAADEIERLRKLADQLAEALNEQAFAWYTAHVDLALAEYNRVVGR